MSELLHSSDGTLYQKGQPKTILWNGKGMRVVIIGAGVAGLACAEQLLRDAGCAIDVTILESRAVPGGFARSRFDVTKGFYTEHSWRGYAPFYRNFFDSVRLVPGIDAAFSKPLHFHLPKTDGRTDAEKLTATDKLLLGVKIAGVLAACPGRRRELARKNFMKGVQERLSEGGTDRVLRMLGPGLGLDMFRTSEYHFGKYMAATLEPDHAVAWGAQTQTPDVFTARDAWVTTSAPTSTAWIDPWVQHLKDRGVKFEFVTRVTGIRVSPDETLSVSTIRDAGSEEGASRAVVRLSPGAGDRLVMAVSPFEAKRVLWDSLSPELLKLWPLTAEGPNSQISFRVAWSRAIPFPEETSVVALPDSAYNLTMCPQIRFWDSGPHPEVNARMRARGVQSLWTGTACSCTDSPGLLFGKTAVECSKAELKEELVAQIVECVGLRNLCGGRLAARDVLDVEIWYEWETGRPLDEPSPSLPCRAYSSARPATVRSDRMLHSSDSKWVTTCRTHRFRPSQNTGVAGFIQCGAHTNTTMDLWSMEGAAESGKIASGLVLGKPSSYLWKHEVPVLAAVFAKLDAAAWAVGAPSAPSLVVFLLIVVVVAMVGKRVCARRRQDYV